MRHLRRVNQSHNNCIDWVQMDFLYNIPEKIKERLKKANLASAQEVLSTPDSIFKNHGCTADDIQFLRSLAAKSLCPKFTSVHNVMCSETFKWDRVLFGCESIDAVTRGIATRGITELCGESGAGKTQLLLQLAIMVQLPRHHGGLGRGAVFINTEDAFPSKRLGQLAQHFRHSFPDVDKNFLENVFVEHILESDPLVNCISFRLPALMRNHNIGVVIIDSVAAIYRIEENIITRADHMRKLADNLMHLIDQFSCAVVCVNQVTADVDNTGIDIPCLGLAWANLIRTRLQLYKTGRYSICKRTGENVPVRKIEVVYSPRCPPGTCEFLITSHGAVSL